VQGDDNTRFARRQDSMTVLRLSRAHRERICIHAEEQYPHECCGVLLGSAGVGGSTVVDVVRAANVAMDSARNRYAIAPAEIVRIMTQARQRGLEIAGFYHSHPDHAAMWSQIDLAEAHWLGCSYLITEVAEGRAKATNSFLLSGTTEEDKHFVHEPIEFID
jgi:proteasome lid subunit RPN8/RPN11